MEPTNVDILKIKIERAKSQLPEETRQAIDAVQWRTTILEMRLKKGYTFEQLGDLEIETDLMLCGLVTPENYPKELEARLHITRAQSEELMKEMNELVFKKIREEFIKITEEKKALNPKPQRNSSLIVRREEGITTEDHQALKSAGIEIIDHHLTDSLELPSPIAQKLSTPVKVETVKTEHALGNLSKTAPTPAPKNISGVDPYREPIE